MFIDIITQPVLQRLNEIERRSVDTKRLMADLAMVLEVAVDENFETEGRGDWDPLTDTTKSRRRHPDGKILDDTGKLSNYITSSYSDTEAVVGTIDIRAATHQFGARKGEYGQTKRGVPIPWGDIPARPFLFVTEDEVQEMEEIVVDYLGV